MIREVRRSQATLSAEAQSMIRLGSECEGLPWPPLDLTFRLTKESADFGDNAVDRLIRELRIDG